MAEQNSLSAKSKVINNKDVMRLLGLSMKAQLEDNLKRIKAGEHIENCNY